MVWLAALPGLLGCSAPEPPRPAPVDRVPPEIALSLGPAQQGGTLAVFVRTDEATRVELEVDGRERPLYPVGDQTWRALVGLAIRAEPEAELVVAATDAWGNRTERRRTIEVSAVEWPETGKLPMRKDKAAVEPEAVARMREERDAVYKLPTPVQLWTGPMRIPVEGGVHTSAYGSFREYPDGSRNHHDAEDIARRKGTPIVAAADGVVALARMQEMHGNAVLIDHGQKVVSLYSHLDAIEVEEGQRIAAGDPLGTMGSTGRTTGPHLHWGVVVDEVAVDPMAWTDEDFVEGLAIPPDDAFEALGPTHQE